MYSMLKTIFLTCLSLLSITWVLSQNTGVGTVSPTHTLHIKTVDGNPNPDPLRIEGLLQYQVLEDTAVLLINPDSGLVRVVHIDSLMSKHGLNLYNTDGVLSENITVGMNTYSLLFAGTDSIYFSPDGTIGIGTTDGATLLSAVRTKLPFIPSLTDDTQARFENNGVASIAILGSNTERSVIMFGDQNNLNSGELSYDHTANQLDFQTNGTTHMSLDSSGYLGIGTQDPLAPLHITGSRNLNPESYILGGDNDNVFSNYTDEFSTLASSTGGIDYSVIAEDRIAANEFNAYSDIRIKKDIEETQAAEDLALLRKLDVKSYKYIDPVRNGTELKKGFIAQEVETVFSQAVGKKTGIIPNVFQTPLSAKWEAGELYIQLEKPHGLGVGDKVKIIVPGGERMLVISQLEDAYSFSAQTPKLDSSRLFVYGSQVSDFHTLDYDEIFTLNVSATQALADKVDELTEMVQKQQELLDRLLEKNKSLEEELENNRK